MASKAQAKLQPWQLYNPLDKSAVVPNIPQSNKFPYNKEPSRTSPLHPKITSVGVVPPRNSMEMSDLKVMLVGNTIGETTKDTGRLETQKVVTDTCKEYRSSENGTKIQHKMPAIIASEGTTTRPSFAVRAKPPPMPRSKPAVIKRKRSLIISKASTKIPSAKKSNSDYTVASPSENLPVEPAKSAVSIEVTDHSVTPIRSIDEMIQTLRSSRQASATSKSLSDQKIDEILQQVMMHAEEWISDSNTEAIENLEERELNCTPRSDEDESVMKDSQEIKETKKGVHIGSTESDIDVSDTVSTLASQISAPAGIPDVTTILARKSSQALRGQSSQMSESSSPFMIVHEEEDITDKEQCLKDLNMSLDVSNCDILNIQGCHPPLVEKPAVIGKEKDFSESRDIPLKPTHHIGGKIHRLCLLPRIKELTVTPSEFALSKVMHSNPDTDISSYGDANPYLNLPKQNAAASQHKPTATEEPKKKGQDISNYLDTSKLDPLDIDGWRRVVEGEFEKRDYTVEGERSEISNWTAWRMMWTVVPPKMALTTSAVKALVFPNYHGTRFPNVDVEESENWNADDNLSQIMSEDEEKHQFNERTLNRRHFSVNDLTKTVSSNFSLQRSSSAPNLAERSYSGSSKIMVKTDYTTAMFEVKEQRESVLKQHMSMLEKQANIEANQEASLETYVYERQPEEKQKAKTFNKPVAPFVSGISFKDEATQRVSLTAQAMNSGRKFIVHSKKKSKSRRSKRFIKNIRKTLLSVRPYSLARSQSADSFLPVSTVASSSPSSSRSKRTSTKLNGKIKRSTSVPRMEEFSWFISRHQKYGEKIEDMREWVRDIWNVWFDEVFPPESEDYSSVYEVEEDTDDLLDTAEKEEENRAREDAKKIPVPDVIAPALSTMPEDVDEPEEVMRAAVIQLTEEISNLRSHETSMKSFHLAKRGSLFRKLGEIKKAKCDLDEAIRLEPLLAPAYWQRHLIRLLKHEYHDCLDDLNAFLKIDKKNISGFRSRADIYAMLGDYTMAIVNYSQAIKLNPDEVEPYFQRATIFEKTGDMLLAMEDYATVVRLNPSRTDALLKRALYNFEKKSWHMAVNEFTKLMEQIPYNAQASTYRGRAYAAIGNVENALKDLSVAIHLDPLNATAFYYRGALLRTAAPEKAIQDLSTSLLLDNSEKNYLALLHRGILYTDMKKYSEALADFEQVLRLDNSVVCAHVNIGLIHLLVNENYWEAIKRFSTAIKVEPTYLRSYVCRADALIRIHDYKSAYCDITRAIHLQPNTQHLYMRRGKLLLQLKKLDLAAFCVRHIAENGKGFVASSPSQKAVIQSFLGNHTAAVDSLSAACRTNPVPRMYVALSKTMIKAKRFREAIVNLHNSLELSNLYLYGDTALSQHQAPPESAEVYFLLGQCYTEMGDLNEALNAYNRALKVNSSYAEAYYQRGLCRLKLDHASGVQDLNKALSLCPTLFEAYLSRAAFYSNKGRYSKAILNCNEALRLQPNSIRALLCRGALKCCIKAFHHAINDLTHAIDLDKQCALAYYNRAVCLHKTEEHQKALKDYSVVLMLTEGEDSEVAKSLRIRVCVNRAMIYLNSPLQDASNAAYDLEEAAMLAPKNTSVLYTMALCYHKLQDLAGAQSAYSRCLDVDPYFLKAYVGRGDAYGDARNYSAARHEFERAIRLDPTYVEARVHLGYNLQLCGRLQQAWIQFSAAISLDPNCQAALEGRAITCLHAGNIFAATLDLSTAMRSGDPSARLLTARGVVYQCQHDLHAAMTHYNRARILDPSYTPAHFNAAVLYMRERRFTDAMECLEVVIRCSPNDSAAILNRAITRVFLNDPEAAMRDFNYALHLDPYNAHIYYNRANLYFVLKEFEHAERDYSSAFEINPSDYVTLKKRADVRGKLGKKEEAVSDYRQSLIILEHQQRMTRRAS